MPRVTSRWQPRNLLKDQLTRLSAALIRLAVARAQGSRSPLRCYARVTKKLKKPWQDCVKLPNPSRDVANRQRITGWSSNELATNRQARLGSRSRMTEVYRSQAICYLRSHCPAPVTVVLAVIQIGTGCQRRNPTWRAIRPRAGIEFEIVRKHPS